MIRDTRFIEEKKLHSVVTLYLPQLALSLFDLLRSDTYFLTGFFFLSRHNSYIQECTGHLEPTYHASIHDLRLLLQRFAFEKSFSEDTGGGGRDSNIKFVPYAMHMILYVLNT